MMFEEVHTYRHTYMQTYTNINTKNTCRRGTGDAHDAGSQSQKTWESRGCEKPKPPKAAKTSEKRSQNATSRRGTGNAEDSKSQSQKATKGRINQQEAEKPTSREAGINCVPGQCIIVSRSQMCDGYESDMCCCRTACGIGWVVGWPCYRYLV